MKLASRVSTVIKPVLRPVYREIVHRPKARRELHDYWQRPWDGSNRPEGYLEGKEKSEFLLKLIDKHADRQSRIIEIGCNVGRNLNHLFLAGFTRLEGIEISAAAVELLNQSYPEMARNSVIHNTPVEDLIAEFEDNEFDIVFTMAVLEHIHRDSEWIFAEMVRIARKRLITIEDERGFSWRHFPRNYRKIFETLGMKQIEELGCNGVDQLGSDFYARVFTRL